MTLATDRSEEARRQGINTETADEEVWPRLKNFDPVPSGADPFPATRTRVIPQTSIRTRILLVEPDPEVRAVLRSFVEHEPDMEIVGEASSGPEALEALRRVDPDVVLLEAEMKEMSGIDLVQSYGVDRFPPAVFVLGNERDAAEVFRLQAVDCIVKPFTHQEFRTTLARVRSHLRREKDERLSPHGSSNAADIVSERRFPHRLWTRTRGQSRGQVLILNVEAIEWIEAQARYSCAHTGDGDHRILESISQIEARLDPARFARVHRSALVNLDRVAEVVSTRNTRFLVLQNGERVPLSRSRKRRLFELAGERR